MAIKEEVVAYHDGDTLLEGLFAFDDTRTVPLPGVLVSHAWDGRGEFVCAKARRLARLGYAAFALDMYGKGVRGNGRDENQRLMMPFMKNRAVLAQRMQAALDTIKGLEQVDKRRIAAIGFCFGGLCVLDLARSGADLRGVVSFHGLLDRPQNREIKPIRAKVLVLHGYEDPMAPAEAVAGLQKELTQAGADWQVHVYGRTLHAFTNPQANDRAFGTVYDDVADRRSWRSLMSFLEETLR